MVEVQLTRMATENIADRRRLFELFNSLKVRSFDVSPEILRA
jgi:hypothetical protein